MTFQMPTVVPFTPTEPEKYFFGHAADEAGKPYALYMQDIAELTRKPGHLPGHVGITAEPVDEKYAGPTRFLIVPMISNAKILLDTPTIINRGTGAIIATPVPLSTRSVAKSNTAFHSLMSPTAVKLYGPKLELA